MPPPPPPPRPAPAANVAQPCAANAGQPVVDAWSRFMPAAPAAAAGPPQAPANWANEPAAPAAAAGPQGPAVDPWAAWANEPAAPAQGAGPQATEWKPHMERTELCRFFFHRLSGARRPCDRGANCRYAHSVADLWVLRGTHVHRVPHTRGCYSSCSAGQGAVCTCVTQFACTCRGSLSDGVCSQGSARGWVWWLLHCYPGLPLQHRSPANGALAG